MLQVVKSLNLLQKTSTELNAQHFKNIVIESYEDRLALKADQSLQALKGLTSAKYLKLNPHSWQRFSCSSRVTLLG